MMDKNINDRNRKNDVILVLRPEEGKTAKNAIMEVDNRLFTGKNNLHAIMDIQTCLWSLKFDSGLLPPLLRQQFTSLTKLINLVKEYYSRRDVVIAEIRD